MNKMTRCIAALILTAGAATAEEIIRYPLSGDRALVVRAIPPEKGENYSFAVKLPDGTEKEVATYRAADSPWPFSFGQFWRIAEADGHVVGASTPFGLTIFMLQV